MDNNTDAPENKIEVEEFGPEDVENVQLTEEIKEEEEEKELEEEDADASTSKTSSGKRACNVCNHSFKFLSRHLEKHGPENCLDCLLNFPTSENLAEHMQDVHNASTNYKCELCELSFSSLVQLGVHTFKHTKRYSCPLCNYTAKGNHKHSLINHIKRHEGKYSVFCDICNRGFFDKNILASHMEIHEDIPKYECEFCKKKFTVKRYLEVHKSLNHKKELFGIEESFQCEICGRNFTFEKSLVRHLSAIHKIGEDRRVNCPVCNKKIANNHNLKKHMRTHTGEKRFCCDECGKAFSEKKYLQKHQAGHVRQEERKKLFLEREKEKAARVRKMKRMNRMYQAPLREYPRQQAYQQLSPSLQPQMQEHQVMQQQEHQLPQEYQQEYQPSSQEYLNMMYRQQLMQGMADSEGQDQEGFAFYPYDDDDDDDEYTLPQQPTQVFLVKTDKGLQIVCNKITPTLLKSFPKLLPKFDPTPSPSKQLCPICGKLVNNLRDHRHKTRFCCKLCFLEVKTEAMLGEHEKLHKEPHHTCEQCPMVFETLTKLALHNHKHTKKYQCPLCNKLFKCGTSMMVHVSNKEKVFKFICAICGKGYVQQNQYRIHMELHENSKKYECKLCDKKFNTKIYLQSHERFNHKKELFNIEEVFQCEYCSRTFSFKRSLKRHLNSIHKVGEKKSYQCHICSKVVTNRYSLTTHLRLHTGEKKFQCQVCGEKMPRKQYLVRHLFRRHGIGDSKPH